jgi:hypothetical protein
VHLLEGRSTKFQAPKIEIQNEDKFRSAINEGLLRCCRHIAWSAPFEILDFGFEISLEFGAWDLEFPPTNPHSARAADYEK